MNARSNRILLALAFSAASSLAFAEAGNSSAAGQPATNGQIPSFQEIDKDNSGYIDENEAQAVAGLDMQNADADNDGRVSEEEFAYAKRNLMPTKGEMNLPSTGKPNVPAETDKK